MRLQTTEKNKLVKTGNKMKKQFKNIVEPIPFKIKDIKLAKLGRDKIDISCLLYTSDAADDVDV